MPRGWWHAVLNIEDTVAITQNYVSDCNLIQVLDFLEKKGDQVSGCTHGKNLHRMFLDAMEKVYPGRVQEVEGHHFMKQKRSRWDELTGKGSATGMPTKFSFNFNKSSA